VTLLLDNMISPKIARALVALGAEAKALCDEFNADTADTDLLRQLGSKGWGLVTVDKRILTRPHEAAMLKEAKVTTFFIRSFFGSLRFWDSALWMIKYWPRLEEMERTIARGTCFIVKHNGKMIAI
jgi:hypothetical protein